MEAKFPHSDKLRETLRGFPEDTVTACAEFQATGSDEAFQRTVRGVLVHYLSPPPPKPIMSYPGSTRLVADLGLDSITMVELVFLFEDLFLVKLPHEKAIGVVTLDDLSTLLHESLPPPATA